MRKIAKQELREERLEKKMIKLDKSRKLERKWRKKSK